MSQQGRMRGPAFGTVRQATKGLGEGILQYMIAAQIRGRLGRLLSHDQRILCDAEMDETNKDKLKKMVSETNDVNWLD